MNENKIHSIKIVLLGGSLSGKTSISEKIVNDTFSKTIDSTNGASYSSKSYYYLNKKIKLEIWDTGGQLRFRALTKFFYKDAKICLLVFDLTNLNSLEDVDYYYNNISLYNNNELYFMILIGNKCDDIKNRVITKNDIEELKKKYNIPYFEISCLNGKNIKELENYICHLSLRFLTKTIKRKKNIEREKNPLIKSDKIKKCFIY